VFGNYCSVTSARESIWTQERGSNRRRRKLHDEESHNFYPSSNIIVVLKLKDEMGGACSTHGRVEWGVGLLFGIPKYRWKDNIN
jgi:hypothetical protein